MTADAIFWIAIGLPLLLVCVAAPAIVLCFRALRGGGEVEFEVKAASLSIRLRTKGTH